MKQYLDLLKDILDNGVLNQDRTGVGTYSVFGRQMRIHLQEGFPLLTTKKVSIKLVFEELRWVFIDGSTDVRLLQERGVQFWNEWIGEDGTIGLGYGRQARHLDGFIPMDCHSNTETLFKYVHKDQLESVIDSITNNPNSRRHLITLWNPLEMDYTTLACCHGTVIQFYVKNKTLSCQMYQRSADIFLGVPYNIAFYALLTHIVAHVTNLTVGDLSWVGGDVHLYANHIEQAELQLSRKPKPLPSINFINAGDFRGLEGFEKFRYENILINGYNPDPVIKAPVAV